MSEQTGEKTEQPTQRRLEEAWKKGQFPRSAEIQTAVVLGGGFMALLFSGREIWRTFADTLIATLAHLHEMPVTMNMMQTYMLRGVLALGKCVWPVLAATTIAGLLAGSMQSQFRTASEALEMNFDRLNPLEGFKRIFSMNATQGLVVGLVKLAIIILLSYGVIRGVLQDPIFFTTVDLSRLGSFMVDASRSITLRILFALGVIAALDYAYQFWRNHQDMMMTRDELKEESKNSDGNPQMKARMRRRRKGASKRKELMDVAQADVVVTNPTHLAIALKYDRKTMKAPKIVAKGSRLNALRIRELARAHQVPILENKPLARLMFKHGRVGAEIPAQLYAAVAEVLAWVYRVNAYRYYREQSQTTH